jgi:hypothetical protein
MASYLEKYLAEAAAVMRVGHWDLRVLPEAAEDDVHMSVDTAPDQNSADIHVGAPFWLSSATDKRLTVAHELAHLHTARITDAAEAAFRHMVSNKYWRSVTSGMDHAEELAADEFARICAPLLPPWEGPDKPE